MNRLLLPLILALTCAGATTEMVQALGGESGPCVGDPSVIGGDSAIVEGDESPDGYLRIDRGEGLMPLYVPRNEDLQFDVELDIGISDVDVGDVELTSGVDPYRTGLPPAGTTVKAASRPQERGWMKSVAKGSYLSYQLEHELKTRLLPQAYPMIFYTDSQRGSENRNRELKIGVREGDTVVDFRSDTHCGGCNNKEHFVEGKWAWSKDEHCKKCKKLEHRVWQAPVSRTVPQGTVDMLSAVYLARTLVREGIPDATFPVVDQQKIWEVHLTRGKRRRIETDMGMYDCQEVQLATKFVAQDGDKKEDSKSHQFEGLFGIKGSIHIWLEARTGVPVMIEGELPVPLPFVDHLDVRVRLKSAKGVPPEFTPVE